MIANRFIISGRVQGVGFRWFTKKRADQIGVKGYVRNMPDGRVEAVAVGTAEQLADFLAELQLGPSASTVASIQQNDITISTTYLEFMITI